MCVVIYIILRAMVRFVTLLFILISLYSSLSLHLGSYSYAGLLSGDGGGGQELGAYECSEVSYSN